MVPKPSLAVKLPNKIRLVLKSIQGAQVTGYPGRYIIPRSSSSHPICESATGKSPAANWNYRQKSRSSRFPALASFRTFRNEFRKALALYAKPTPSMRGHFVDTREAGCETGPTMRGRGANERGVRRSKVAQKWLSEIILTSITE